MSNEAPEKEWQADWVEVPLIERWSTFGKIVSHEAWLESYHRYRGTVVGHDNQCILISVKQGRATFYYDDSDMVASAAIGSQFYESPTAVDRLLKESQIANAALSLHCDVLESLTYADLDGDRISSLLQRYFELHVAALSFYKISAEEFVADIEQTVASEIGRDAIKDLPVLLRPDTSNLATAAERASWRRVLEVAHRRPGTHNIKEELARHAKKFGYLGAAGGNPAGWSAEYFEERLAAVESQGIQAELDRLASQLEAQSQDQAKLYETERRLRLTPVVSRRIAGIRASAVQRMAIREHFTRGAFATNPLFNEIYDRLRSYPSLANLSNEVLRQLKLKEIVSFLQEGLLPNNALLEARYLGYVFGFDRKGPVEISIEQEVIRAQHQLSGGNTAGDRLMGSVAYAGGVVTGLARVIDSGTHTSIKIREAGLMQRGEILVTGMTHPNIIAACEKAAAIVTDQGGVTSHAAIVARELKIPCVIGTRFATKFIRTGDRIKVDSVSGIVTKV